MVAHDGGADDSQLNVAAGFHLRKRQRDERIRLNFGENYGITITSTYGEGTCVTVRLPQY